MPAGTRQLKRRNHTVNKSYLLRFADDRACLTGVTLPDEVRVSVSVNDATVVKNFYVVQLQATVCQAHASARLAASGSVRQDLKAADENGGRVRS